METPDESAAASEPRPEGRRRQSRLIVDPAPYLVDFATLPATVDWVATFGSDRPVELEIGSGKGLFLANEGARRPDVNFFGIEIAKKYAKEAAIRVAKKSLANVRVLPGDARAFLEKHAPTASLDAVHVYFPDPWWKKRHRKRRVFCEGLVVDLERVLKPNADLWVVTDVEEYFGVMIDLMSRHDRFILLPPPPVNTPEHELDYLTNFERKYRIEGRPIHRAHYRYLGPEIEPQSPQPSVEDGRAAI